MKPFIPRLPIACNAVDYHPPTFKIKCSFHGCKTILNQFNAKNNTMCCVHQKFMMNIDAVDIEDKTLNRSLRKSKKIPLNKHIKGIYKSHDGRRWVVQVRKNKKCFYVGCFETKEEAYYAVCKFNKENG